MNPKSLLPGTKLEIPGPRRTETVILGQRGSRYGLGEGWETSVGFISDGNFTAARVVAERVKDPEELAQENAPKGSHPAPMAPRVEDEGDEVTPEPEGPLG